MNLMFPGWRVCARAARILTASVFIFIVICQLPTTRAAATFNVNSLLDTRDAAPGNGACADANGACTLRAAIEEANSLSGDDTITFSVNGTINLTGPLPVLSSSVTINGPGSSLLTVRRDTGGDYRILQTSGNFSISGLTITNGKSPDGAPGGGILHTDGELILRDVVITGNATGNGGPTSVSSTTHGGNGGDGGGIHASIALTMTDCVVSNNTTGNGGIGSEGGGSGGSGGGIYLAPGNLTLNNVVISGNRTGDTGGPTGGSSGNGGGVLAGDPFLIHPTIVLMNRVTVTNNNTGSGGNAGDSGSGGGIYLNSARLNLTDSSITNNHTGNANPAGSFRTAGSGGGVFNNGELIVMNSLFSGNKTGSSGPGSFSSGGGIANLSAGSTLVNTTISGNSTGSGDSRGGGIYSISTTRLINCTITKNVSPNGLGNGVTGNQGLYLVANTIIAGNGASGNGPDLDSGSFIPPSYFSRGHNLIGNAQGVSDFDEPGDQTGSTAAPLDPKLGPLANNGGPTLTHALLSNSTALDAGDNVLAVEASFNFVLTTDQRGVQRFADSPDADSTATVDIGAFEFHQTIEDISNKTINEDTVLNVTFGIGDNSPGITSVTATSNNQALLPAASLVLSGAGGARTLRITPVANQSGVALVTVTVNLSGGGTLIDTFTLTVVSINDRPSFSILGAQTVLEDAGAQTVANFAGNVSAGPFENAQSISFTVTVSNPELFSVVPSVSSSGVLTYTPAPNANGVTNVKLILKDNGGTDNGGEDSSIEQTFTISVLPVNDAPTFTRGPNQTINEDAGSQFLEWATNLSQGPNEFDQFDFQITNNTNPGLFSQQPSVHNFGFSGFLTYMPVANASGSADITIVLKDTGGTANGGMDTSVPQTLTITVNAVNDAPVINLQSSFVQTNQHTPLVFSAANSNGIGLSDIDAGTNPIRVTLTATQGTLALPSTAGLTFITGDGVDDETMTFTGLIGTINSRLSGLTFKPNNGFAGFANLQIVADDEGHSGAGGARTATSSITINVLSGGRLSFNTATYGVNESGTTATITVLRAGGAAGTTSVNYATSNGTATSGASCTTGVDYLPASGSFTWNNGDSSVRQFTLTICNDGLNENDETINLTLSNVTGTGSLGTQPAATLTIGNDEVPVLLTEELTEHAIALDLVTQTRDPFSLTNPFNLGADQRRRVSLFVWRLALLPGDTVASVQVSARDDEGRTYDLPVEALNPMVTVPDVTQVVVRLPDNVIGAPRDLRLKVTLRGSASNEAFIKIASP